MITITVYGIDSIMSPLGRGDITLMREAFPEVPAGELVPAAGEVSLYMSRFGTGWIASGKPPRAKGGGDSWHVGVCIVKTVSHEAMARPGLHEEDTAICAVNGVSAVGDPALTH